MVLMRDDAKLISRLVLFTLLIWSITPEQGYTYSPVQNKINKSGGEHILLNLDLNKQNNLNSSSKESNYAVENQLLNLNLNSVCDFLKPYLQVNAFLRNTFYVNPTINAP